MSARLWQIRSEPKNFSRGEIIEINTRIVIWLRYIYTTEELGLPQWRSGKKFTCQYRRCRFDPWVEKIPWKRAWQPTSVFLPGECHGQRSLAGYSPWGCKESDTTEATEHACIYTHILFHILFY